MEAVSRLVEFPWLPHQGVSSPGRVYALLFAIAKEAERGRERIRLQEQARGWRSWRHGEAQRLLLFPRPAIRAAAPGFQQIL